MQSGARLCGRVSTCPRCAVFGGVNHPDPLSTRNIIRSHRHKPFPTPMDRAKSQIRRALADASARPNHAVARSSDDRFISSGPRGADRDQQEAICCDSQKIPVGSAPRSARSETDNRVINVQHCGFGFHAAFHIAHGDRHRLRAANDEGVRTQRRTDARSSTDSAVAKTPEVGEFIPIGIRRGCLKNNLGPCPKSSTKGYRRNSRCVVTGEGSLIDSKVNVFVSIGAAESYRGDM